MRIAFAALAQNADAACRFGCAVLRVVASGLGSATGSGASLRWAVKRACGVVAGDCRRICNGSAWLRSDGKSPFLLGELLLSCSMGRIGACGGPVVGVSR